MSYATCHVQLVSCVVIDVLYDYKLSYIYMYSRKTNFGAMCGAKFKCKVKIMQWTRKQKHKCGNGLNTTRKRKWLHKNKEGDNVGKQCHFLIARHKVGWWAKCIW